MARLVINQDRVTADIAKELAMLCPFNAFEYEGGQLEISAACKMCRLCVKKGPSGVVEYIEDEATPEADKSEWNGIAVFAEQENGEIAPVVFELLGKARELADKTSQPVYALLAGHGMEKAAQALRCYLPDRVYVYDDEALADFRVCQYAAVFEDFISKAKPSGILVGATNLGRSLAPRVAARFGTGLTADCTRLEIKENTDIVQIRPAFGGNIMAQIITPKHRPQFCTVRYKIFATPEAGTPSGELIEMPLPEGICDDGTRVLEVIEKKKEIDISEADAIVAVGRGVKTEKDLELARRLAQALDAQLACTRPLIENGWFDAKKQIGLSGRTVKPKIIVTLGVSGSVQFAAGMQNAECIIAVNSDENAPIFDIAHYALVGDLYAVVPPLLELIEKHQNSGGCAAGE